MVQNKFHYAITGQTSAEIVHSHADPQQRKDGANNMENAPEGRILKSDVSVAKTI